MRKSSCPNGLPQHAREEESQRRGRVFPANEAIEGVAAALFAELLGLAAQRRRSFPYNQVHERPAVSGKFDQVGGVARRGSPAALGGGPANDVARKPGLLVDDSGNEAQTFG